MCKECDYRHQTGYRCPCECHEPIDRIIAERDFSKTGEDGNGY